MKVILIFPVKDIQKNNTWWLKSAGTAKTNSKFEKKKFRIFADKFEEKSPNFIKFGLVTKKLLSKIFWEEGIQFDWGY